MHLKKKKQIWIFTSLNCYLLRLCSFALFPGSFNHSISNTNTNTNSITLHKYSIDKKMKWLGQARDRTKSFGFVMGKMSACSFQLTFRSNVYRTNTSSIIYLFETIGMNFSNLNTRLVCLCVWVFPIYFRLFENLFKLPLVLRNIEIFSARSHTID